MLASMAAKTVAEINPRFLHASLAQTPKMLALKVVFGKLLPVPKLCKNVSTMCIYAVGKSVFRPKKTTICNAKFEDLGNNGGRGSKYVVESAIFGIADPDLPITMQLLWGYNDD